MSEKILVVQTGFLGDAVLASGMLRAIASLRPEAAVGMVVRADVAELFADHPALTYLHPLDKRADGATAALIETLREHRYDVAILAHRSFRSGLIARRAGIPKRVGFRQSDGAWLLSDRVEYDISMHETERNAVLLRAVGIVPSGSQRMPWLLPRPELVEAMRSRFGGGAGLVLLAPGSVWNTKQWTEQGFADAARMLTASGTRVVLVGSRADRDRCDLIARAAGLPPESVTAGEISLGELLALISIAARVIANDSAPVHLAGSVGTPVTAIFGPTVPEFGFGPLGAGSNVVELRDLACRPCRIHGSRCCPIGTHECMERIPAEMVLVGMKNSNRVEERGDLDGTTSQRSKRMAGE